MAELTVREVIGDVLGEVADEELPLFSEFDGVDDATVDRALRQRGRSREPLGFGLETVVPMVSPVLWGVLTHYATMATTGTFHRLRDRLRRRGPRPAGDDRSPAPAPASAENADRYVLPYLDRDTIERIERMCLEQCMASGMDEPRAAQVAAALAARLRLHSAPAASAVAETEPDGSGQ